MQNKSEIEFFLAQKKGKFDYPLSEAEFRKIFEKHANEVFGLRISTSQTKCPDIIAFDTNEKVTKKIELEYKASNFFLHKHHHDAVDMIYCWENDIKKSHIPIVECKDRLLKYCNKKSLNENS